MKTVLLLLIFLFCVGCGAIYALDLLVRLRQLEEVLSLVRYLRREIRCDSAPLSVLLSGERCPAGLPLLKRLDCGEPFDVAAAYEAAKRRSRPEMFFRTEDWNICDTCFRSLGEGSGEERVRHLDLCESMFSAAQTDARTKLKENGKLALVLGVCAGTVLVLMLI